MNPKWTIEYDNDVGPSDESFMSWWTVSDGDNRSYRCYTQEEAEGLAKILNAHPEF